MLLTSIQIHGFKSFADKTELKFGKGITAVVGPNGSGKSNISDAVRWVLGEQSTKSLRGQSMEDVIFGGTDNRRPHGFCEVTLNINNTDRTLNFDNDFVSVTRRYYRSHESEYLINNVSVRLKDVHELFMDTGIGRDGYSMIGQGKIDNIISSRSDERRDIFEEASGISRYRYRKTEAERKLIAAEDNLLRLKDIINELETRVGPLEEQSKKAEKFLHFSERKKQLEIGLWLYILNNSKDALRAQESKIDAATLKYKEIEKALQDFDVQSEKNSDEFSNLTSQIEQEKNSISHSNEKIVKLQGDITIIENDILHNNESIERLNKEKMTLSTSDAAAKVDADAKKSLAEEKQSDIIKLNSDIHTLENELSSLLADSQTISLKIEEEVRKLNLLSSESSDKRVEMVTANTSIEEISSRNQQISSLIEQNTTEKSLLTAQAKDTNELLFSIDDTITSCNNTLKGFELRLKSRKEKAFSLKSESEELRLDIEAKKRRVQILTELESNMDGFSNSVKSVVSEAEKGIIRGVHGTVSKLINVEKEYSVAIETALGNNIQNIIVDNESDAKRAISYLKSNHLGRATFMPISSIKSREFKQNRFDDILGFIGIAADLVETDSKYQEIIKYLLGGTVVTEDIDSAVALAKKYDYKIKVVSLDGQVVNTGGSLTGGSLVKQAGILSRRADIEGINKEIKKLTARQDKINTELSDAESALSEIEADIKSVTAEITTSNEDKIRTVSELKRLESLLYAIDNTLSELTSENKNTLQKITALKETAKTAAEKIAEIDLEKTSLQKHIDSMMGGRDSNSQKREALTNDITALKLLVIDTQKDVSSLLDAAQELEKGIGARSIRTGEIDAEIAALSYKNNQLTTEVSQIKDEIDNTRFLIEECADNIEKLIAKRNDIEKFGIELRNTEKQRTLERENIGGELARLTERKDVMIKEYDNVISQLYDEYQLTKSEAENLAIAIDKPNDAKKELAEIKSKIRSLGSVNVSAIEEYNHPKGSCIN